MYRPMKQAKEDQKEVEKQEVQQREKPAFKKNYVKQRLPEDKDIFYGRNFEGEETEIHEIIDEMGEVVVRERSFSWRPGRSVTRRPS